MELVGALVSNYRPFADYAGAHLGGKGDTSPALKKKSVFEKAFCPENV